MTHFITHFWAWWASAFAVGAATALILSRRPERGGVAGWLAWFGLAFLVGLPVAHLQILPGRGGLWLETGLGLFASFLAGAALGAVAGGRSLRAHEGWAVGLAPLALIWIGAGVLGGDPLAAGRKSPVVAESVPPPAEEKGVAAAEPPRQAPAPAAPKEPPARPVEIDRAVIAKAEPQSPAEPPALAGPLDAAACNKAVATTLAAEPIRFTRSGVGIRRVSSGALEKVVGLLKRCPTAAIEVRGLGEADDPAERRLAEARAERVADYLERMGVERGRLVAQARSANGAESGVELVVGPRR